MTDLLLTSERTLLWLVKKFILGKFDVEGDGEVYCASFIEFLLNLSRKLSEWGTVIGSWLVWGECWTLIVGRLARIDHELDGFILKSWTLLQFVIDCHVEKLMTSTSCPFRSVFSSCRLSEDRQNRIIQLLLFLGGKNTRWSIKVLVATYIVWASCVDEEIWRLDLFTDILMECCFCNKNF